MRYLKIFKKSQKFCSLSLLNARKYGLLSQYLTVQFTSLVAFAKKNPYFVSHGNFCRSSLTRFTSVCSDFYFKLTQIFVYRSNDYTTDLRLVTSFRCHV